MRRVVCRFDDESSFLRQFQWEPADCVDDAATFMFVGEFALDLGEQFNLNALVSSHREHCHLRMTVIDRTVECDEDELVFRYRARVAPEDAVWLLAFRQKLSTRRWLEELAA